MPTRVNYAIVRALAKRDLRLYFSSAAGYVFITLFIFLSAAAAFWQDRFFLDNLANLDQLNGVFPFLLLLFIPALTMSVWSEERRLGTAELLFTLPATDFELVLGKYAATLGIYTASLVLSLSHVLVLFFLGSPDLGLMFGNYVGFWLVGAALIPVGMLASLLTINATVAFILGTVFCGVVIFVDSILGSLSVDAGRAAEALTVFAPFWDFSKGVLTLSGLLAFVSVAGFFLYLNTLVASRRHWPRDADGLPMWSHHAVRAVALAVALVAANAVAGRATVRLDVTGERLSSVSAETRRLLAELPDDRPVFIQAFLSPNVPEPFVQARSNLIGILEEIDALSGGKVQVLIEDTEPFTDAAVNAREKFGIRPRAMRDVAAGRAEINEVFLGVAFTAGAAQQVIPFFDRGLPTEYEIMRTIRVVSGTERKRVGVVDTMVKIFGGQNLTSQQQMPRWSVVNELQKQYEVVEVNAEFPIPDDIDALIVALPSSMQTDQMTNVAGYIRQGKPAMILVDPLPAVNPTLAPTEWVGDGNPMTYPPGQPKPGPRGNVRRWIADLGVDWEPTRVVWDSYNPHPDLSYMPSEVVFLGAGNENPETFNSEADVSKDLQELVFLYPGFLGPGDDPDVEFEPLLHTGVVSGNSGYFTLVQQSFFGPQINPSPVRDQDDETYVIAARVRKVVDAVTASAEPTPPADGDSPWPTEGPVNAVVIADLDFISEQFFQIRETAPANLNFDNVTFFLNAMDSLVEDDSFIALRSRRARHRTLERVEAQTAEFIEQRTLDEQQAEADAEQALTDAQNRLNERVAEVQDRDDIDAQAKQIMARNLQEVENRRLQVLSTNIQTEKETQIRASLERMETQIRAIQSRIKTFAILLPPVPVLAFGVMVFVRRQRRERDGAAAAKRLRE
ncbi:MAG: Gldg family protein [Vicinamibacterales bacterium]|nr:Gldg family protein [Vicinamibacterales bacterium]